MRRGRKPAGCVVLAVVLTLSASSALAASDFWYTGTLADTTGYAGLAAHSITYIQGVANANGFCVAKDQGITGYAGAGRTPAGTQACATSGGFASRSENAACCYHGWIANKNETEITVDPSTRYDY
jgi:hypothetical protein